MNDVKELTTSDLIEYVKEPKKRAFLDNYHCFMRANRTAEAIGVAESTIYDWIRLDEKFKLAYLALKKDLDNVILDMHLNNIRDITFNNDTPPQTRLLGSFFEVKKLDTTYRDRVVDLHVSGDIVFKTSMPGMVVDAEEVKELT